jgi:methylaspartate ammonia-lyase
MKKIFNSIVLITLISLFGIAHAQENIEYVDILGVQVQFNDDNSFKSLKSTAEQDLVFTDRTSIRQAVAIATMSAKGELAKWMEETIVSKEGLEEASTQIANRQTDGSGQTLAATKEDIQTYLRSLSNSANAVLTGVTVIDQIIDRDKKYVSVTIGVSEKYMQAAAQMRTEMSKSIAEGREAEINMNNASSFGGSSEPPVDEGRTHRRSPAFDDF